MSTRVLTTYHPKIIDADGSTAIYEYLRDNIKWVDGIRSKQGFTRKAKPMTIGEDEILDSVIVQALNKIGVTEAAVYGIYLNYYRDGNDWTPNHSHPGMKQVVISLGATRTLTMGKGSHTMSNGDVIIFGSSIHGVPKDPNCKDGRISIAMFLAK